MSDPGAAVGRVGIAQILNRPVVRVIARRLWMAALLLFVVSALSFVLVSLIPGDAARQILGQQATPEAYARLRHALGLDLPLYEQYWRWASHAFAGDLGESLYTGSTVTSEIGSRLPVTLSLILGSLIVSGVVGVAVGLVGAVRGGIVGRALDAFALVGFAFPSFWIGAVLISIFAVKLGWLPATGYVPLEQSASGWLKSLALPVVALSLGGIAMVAKQTHEAMLGVLGSEYVRMARARGVPERAIVFRHALKNAGLPILTVLGILAVGVMSGSVVVETVFALPGLGSLALTASVQHDLPLIEGSVVYFAVIVVAINLAVDLAYTWLNPKVKV